MERFKVKEFHDNFTNYHGFCVVDSTGFIYAVRKTFESAEHRRKQLEERK